MRVTALLAAAAMTPVVLGPWASSAAGAQTTCAVNASAGYVNCLTSSDPPWEEVKANQGTGTPYRFQLQRPSTGSTWGWWEYGDQALHVIPLTLTGSITAQVDNRGTANPATYWVKLA